MFLFAISVQSQAVLNSGTRSRVVRASIRGPRGGVGPAENVAEDGVGAGGNQDEAGAEGDAETSDDEEEMDTDDDDVCFSFVTCRKCKSRTSTFWCRFNVNRNIFQSDDDGDSGGDE